MTKKKNLFTESEWTRVAPKWQFWDKQETKTFFCTKCDFKRTLHRTHYSSVSAHLATWGLSLSLMLHAEEHAPKKKAKS